MRYEKDTLEKLLTGLQTFDLPNEGKIASIISYATTLIARGETFELEEVENGFLATIRRNIAENKDNVTDLFFAVKKDQFSIELEYKEKQKPSYLIKGQLLNPSSTERKELFLTEIRGEYPAPTYSIFNCYFNTDRAITYASETTHLTGNQQNLFQTMKSISTTIKQDEETIYIATEGQYGKDIQTHLYPREDNNLTEMILKKWSVREVVESIQKEANEKPTSKGKTLQKRNILNK